jgi:hypothetical protein
MPVIKDAHGRAFPLIRHETLIPGISNRERLERLNRAAQKDKRTLTRAEKRRIIGWSVATLAVLFPVAVVPPFVMSYHVWWGALLFLPLSIFPMLVTAFVMRRALAQRIADTYLRAGICPSCAYELKGIAPAHDQTRTCPECGGTWATPVDR